MAMDGRLLLEIPQFIDLMSDLSSLFYIALNLILFYCFWHLMTTNVYNTHVVDANEYVHIILHTVHL